MPDPKLSLLLATAAATALLHTLIPDHWLPFVLVGRARGWTIRETALWSGISAIVHAGLSIALGLGARAIGIETASRLGEQLESASGVLLITFGLAYAGWAWRKGGHFHPGGALVHRPAENAGCDGREGPEHPDHLHYHADEKLIRGGGGRGSLGLALIVGLNPCVLILPIFLATPEHETGALALVIAAYAVTTTVLMIGLSVIGVGGARRISVPGAARHMETASGILIATVGAVVLVLGH